MVLGGNPFLAIIITAFNPTKTLLARVTNCGADALLVKPLSPKQIQERVHALIDAPRKFVVTSDFVGPDRRKSAREDSPIPLIDAPNTLRLKALNMAARVNLNELINRAIVDVNEQKLLRHAFQAAFLIEFAIAVMPGQPTDRMALDHLQRVVPVLEDLTKRLPAGGTGNRATVASQATELIQAVEIARSQALSGMVPPGLDRLKEMALGIMKTLTPERSADAMGKEVADAAAAYLARLQAMAEAKAAENATSITAPLTGTPTTFTR